MRPRKISTDAPAVRHGLGLFETMLAVRGRVPMADAHFARLAATAGRLGLAEPDRAEFDRHVRAALRGSSRQAEAAVRVQWLALGEGGDEHPDWQLVASASPLPAATLSRRRYGRAITLPPGFSRGLPFAKTTSWLAASVGLRKALAAGADEGFFVDRRHRILEGTSTNVFAVDGDRLLTAPVESVLPGVVRAWVMQNAAHVGWRVVERAPSRQQLLAGGFMTSSLTKISPLRRLDGRPCVRIDDPRLQQLRKLFERRLYES